MEGRFAENAIQHGRFSYKTIELASICFLETRGGRFGENWQLRRSHFSLVLFFVKKNKGDRSKEDHKKSKTGERYRGIRDLA